MRPPRGVYVAFSKGWRCPTWDIDLIPVLVFVPEYREDGVVSGYAYEPFFPAANENEVCFILSFPLHVLLVYVMIPSHFHNFGMGLGRLKGVYLFSPFRKRRLDAGYDYLGHI